MTEQRVEQQATTQEQTLVLASGNRGKQREFSDLLHPLGLHVRLQSEFDVVPVAETGLSFVENAILKARHACQTTGFAALADDSGLEVDALSGAPGIYSARYSGENATDASNNAKLLAQLEQVPTERRGACFRCVLVLMRHPLDATPIIAEGHWRGRILEAPRGSGGFGYDPLFWLASHDCASAELDKQEKNHLSHRAVAMRSLVSRLQQRSFKDL